MEVAGQWRREWAGAAEYGKVTEGGVTRRVARAMEVLQAQGPGAKVRVLRAAWHSSAGPGAPMASYMLHSSRQVITSGSRMLSSPSLTQSKPLEISSIPFDTSGDECTDTENYKVTEPDDIDISEPSKWKSSTKRSSFRMPSEESSSTDNASIIDLDSRINSLKRNSSWRRHSYDSETSEIAKPTSRASPLLDTPVALSTLKFKSLLNNSNDIWNNRRKSYSFEDTSPLSESILQSNDTLAMESSTDSGICKSTEIVNDVIEEECEKTDENITRNSHIKEETFKDWLARNRQINAQKNLDLKTNKENISKPYHGNVSLQATGKVSITLAKAPIKLYNNDDDTKRMKRVDFCKTELHFAAESGKVNIIATDEKPPPSNDFRKRRSAFVPIRDNFNKHVTLFGEKYDNLLVIKDDNGTVNNDVLEIEEENTAATKSILKNKIPKPKPYLLGENMDVGEKEIIWEPKPTKITPSTVSLMNKPIEVEPACVKKVAYDCSKKMQTGKEIIHKIERTMDTDPTKTENGRRGNENSMQYELCESPFKNTLRALQSSPILQSKFKTRELKEKDLTYFGIDNKKKVDNKSLQEKYEVRNVKVDDMFNSVRLVQQSTNHMQKSNDKSTDYKNLPFKTDFTPIPAPRSRLQNDYHDTEFQNLMDVDIKHNKSIEQNENSRRSRIKNEDIFNKNRSISEPPKYRQRSHGSSQKNEIVVEPRVDSPVTKSGEYSDDKLKYDKTLCVNNNTESNSQTRTELHKEEINAIPLYENIIKNKTSERKGKIKSDTLKRQIKEKLNTTEKVLEQNLSKNKESRSHKRDRSLDPNKIRHIDSTVTSTHKEQENGGRKYSIDSIKENKHVRKEVNVAKGNETNNKDKRRVTNKEMSDQHTQKKHHSNIAKNATTIQKENVPVRHINGSLNKVISNTNKTPNMKDKSNNELVDVDIKRDKRSRHNNEYVLKYDDKNGTFSSISKIKHNSSKISEKNKNNSSRKKQSTENKKDGKNNEKHYLLESTEGHRHNGMYSAERKWKSKIYTQRTCQVL